MCPVLFHSPYGPFSPLLFFFCSFLDKSSSREPINLVLGGWLSVSNEVANLELGTI